MELLFIDESAQVKKNQKSHFVLLGVIVSSKNLIPLEQYLFKIKEKYSLSNLKNLRTNRDMDFKQRLKISKELYGCLEVFNIRLLSAIMGPYSVNNHSEIDNYYDALTFIIERFYFYLHKQNKRGMIVLDSNCKEITKEIKKKIYNYILSEEKREGKIRKRIYGPIFFCEDEFSNIIQLSDLCVAGLQRASWELLKKLEKNYYLKGNEDILIEYNDFLKIYWKYFVRYRGKVSGAGIKYWN